MLTDALAGIPGVTEVRGVGLMIGVELASHELSEAVAQLCFRRGLLVLECGKKAIRFSPPLILTEAQAARDRRRSSPRRVADAQAEPTRHERAQRRAGGARLLHLDARRTSAVPLEIVGGEGARFTTADGARWWDLGSMTWNAALGHGHPRMQEGARRRRPRAACSSTRRRSSRPRRARASCSPR